MNEKTAERIFKGQTIGDQTIESIKDSVFKLAYNKERDKVTIDIVKAVIVYRDFSGKRYGEANRNITIAVSPEILEDLDKFNIPYKTEIVDGFPPIYTINAKLKYRDKFNKPLQILPDISYIVNGSNGEFYKSIALNENTVGLLDSMYLRLISFTINFYHSGKDSESDPRKIAIKKMKAVQIPLPEYDGIYDGFKLEPFEIDMTEEDDANR